MKQLKEAFNKDGIRWRLNKRTKWVAMYDTLAQYSDSLITHEVFMIPQRDDKFGKREGIPSNSEHGINFKSKSFGGVMKPQAEEYYRTLVEGV